MNLEHISKMKLTGAQEYTNRKIDKYIPPAPPWTDPPGAYLNAWDMMPDDLKGFLVDHKGGNMFRCPCCGNMFGIHWAGMPETFRAHIRPYMQGEGCFFAPKAKARGTRGKTDSF